MKRLLWCFLLLATPLSAEITEFARLMGKATPHWGHVSQEKDLEALERFEKLYEKHKHFRFTEAGNFRIPKIIHFIWLGPRPFPPESVENVRTWIAQNPDWTVKFWSDRPRPLPCKSMKFCLVEEFPFLFLGHCFKDSKNWGEKSDVLRFEILYQQGGVYVDHDANCLQSFSGIHRGYDFYCGLEAPHPPFAKRNITCGNGVIGSKPYHPVVGKVIELIGKDWEELGKKFQGKDGYSRTQLVMERTYMMLTNALESTLGQEGNRDIVFPAAYFFAKKQIPSLYSKHFFGNAWAQEGHRDLVFEKSAKKAMGKLHRRNRAIRLFGLGAIALNCLGFALLFVFMKRKVRCES